MKEVWSAHQVKKHLSFSEDQIWKYFTVLLVDNQLISCFNVIFNLRSVPILGNWEIGALKI
ncbi:hypothetical protein D3C71_785990 [compost metagenome]